jgi:hypothetical protein
VRSMIDATTSTCFRSKHGDGDADSKRAVRGERGLTLGLSEFLLLDTGLDGLVELGVESGRRRDGDLVVGLDILLDRLTAIVDALAIVCGRATGENAVINTSMVQDA